MKKFLSLLAVSGLIGASLWAAPASALPVAQGHIVGVFVSSPGNMAFRVSLDTTLPSSCTDGFLYTDTSNGNYQAYVSTLLLAYSTNKLLNIEYTVDSNGFCQIAEFGSA